MKKHCLVFGMILICLILFLNFAVGDSSYFVEKAAKSVLKISVYDHLTGTEPFATGSGFVAFDNATLITNYHVVEGSLIARGTDDDGNMYVIDKVLCADKEADIAILRFSNPTSLQPLELYPDDQLIRGSRIYAIGSPKGLKNTVSDGVISSQFDENGIPWIQITAPISPGSSGGALFNEKGQVIGVTTASYKSKDDYGNDTDAQNINFAVNIAVAQAMYNAWNGKTTEFRYIPNTARMDFSGVYKHDKSPADVTDAPESKADDSTESWVCLNCGKENTTKFCQECGAEKPFWTCSCGKKNSSNKFCGDCGTSLSKLLDTVNSAIKHSNSHNYSEAVQELADLGQFNSGSFDTAAGGHIEAVQLISKIYYDQGIYLQSINGSHEEILEAFYNAGDYGDPSPSPVSLSCTPQPRLFFSSFRARQDRLKLPAITVLTSWIGRMDQRDCPFDSYIR